jgi:hypothetical protein
MFNATGKRAAYNRLLKHMIVTTTIVDRFEKGENLADILNDMLDAGAVSGVQIPAILNVILVSRAALPFRSMNLPETVSVFSTLSEKFLKWNALDLVVAYHHPTFGIQLVNPARTEHWMRVHELKRDELIVVYSRARAGGNDVARRGLDAFFTLLSGKSPVEEPAFMMPVEAPKPAAPAQPAAPAAPAADRAAPPAAAPSKATQMTPKYSVQVSNELFHNGNVEAWKNIIEAYHAKYPNCRVIVFHEGELIQDLNSLFKWGKVKHGGVIMFQVAGSDIKGVSRLQRYLYEGASPRFEAFLKKDVNKVLNLF